MRRRKRNRRVRPTFAPVPPTRGERILFALEVAAHVVMGSVFLAVLAWLFFVVGAS